MSDARPAARRLLYVASALLFTLVQLHPRAQQGAPALARVGSTWADEVLKTEAYVTPPKELADAVTIPR